MTSHTDVLVKCLSTLGYLILAIHFTTGYKEFDGGILVRPWVSRDEYGTEHIMLDAYDKRHTMPLHPATRLANLNPPVYLFKYGNVVIDEPPEDDNPITIYRSGRSMLAVGKRDPHSETLSMDGVFDLDNGESYYVRHHSPDEGLHTFGRRNTRHAHKLDDDFARATQYVDTYVRRRRHREVVRAVVDVLVIVDHKIYRQELADRGGDVRRTLGDIRRYYTLLISMVDVRYQAIADRRLNIRVKLVGIMIAQDRQSSSWSEYHVQRNPDDPTEAIIDPDTALEQLHQWLIVKMEERSLPQHDHAMAFTGYPLYKVSSHAATSGMAYVGTICKVEEGWSCSVVTEVGGFVHVGTAAHELGHSLGATHDGSSEAYTCPPSGNYIMTPTNVGSAEVLKNFFSFSPCSIHLFRRLLGTPQADCLLDSTVEHSRDYMKILPGERIGIEEQCSDVFGPDSEPCPMEEMMKNVCLRLWCTQPDNPSRCQTTGTLHAVFGTPCGEDKFCRFDECLPRSEFYRIYNYHEEKRCKEDHDKFYCYRNVFLNKKACEDPRVRQYCCLTCAA